MEHRRGLWFGVAAYLVWGLSPIFWNLLDEVPSLEVLAHRVVWAIPILLLVIAVRGRWHELWKAAADRRTVALAIASGVLLSVNWGVFIWAVTSGHIVEASLGYFINPLVSVALGVAVLHERLRPAQMLAVAVASAGVLAMTVMLGVVPWVSLALAFSFGFYGLLKKRGAAAGPVEGLLGETTTVGIPLLVYLVVVTVGGHGAFGTAPGTTILLVASGIVTVVPLVLFGAAAQRIPLSTVGVLQYLAPSLQLVIGVVVYDERMTGAEVVGFTLVWIAIAIYTADTLRSPRRSPAPVAGPAGS